MNSEMRGASGLRIALSHTCPAAGVDKEVEGEGSLDINIPHE